MSFVSYAQNFEDVMLWRALKHVKKGFYVDVGAQDPVVDSVSLAFYERGWRGIHVEPIPHYANLLRMARPEDLVVQAAIAEVGAVLAFFEVPDSGISTASREIADRHRAAGFDIRETVVPSLPLSAIFDRCEGTEIHWLKLDIEGYESRALHSWGDSSARPWIVVVESTLPLTQLESHESWEFMLTRLGYLPAYFDGLNRFYVSSNQAHLKSAFESPPNVFDGFSLNGSANAPFHSLIRDRAADTARNLTEAAEKEAVRAKSALEAATKSLEDALGEMERQRLAHIEEMRLLQASHASHDASLNNALAAKEREFAQLLQQSGDEFSTLVTRHAEDMGRTAAAAELDRQHLSNEALSKAEALEHQLNLLRDKEHAEAGLLSQVAGIERQLELAQHAATAEAAINDERLKVAQALRSIANDEATSKLRLLEAALEDAKASAKRHLDTLDRKESEHRDNERKQHDDITRLIARVEELQTKLQDREAEARIAIDGLWQNLVNAEAHVRRSGELFQQESVEAGREARHAIERIYAESLHRTDQLSHDHAAALLRLQRNHVARERRFVRDKERLARLLRQQTKRAKLELEAADASSARAIKAQSQGHEVRELNLLHLLEKSRSDLAAHQERTLALSDAFASQTLTDRQQLRSLEAARKVERAELIAELESVKQRLHFEVEQTRSIENQHSQALTDLCDELSAIKSFWAWKLFPSSTRNFVTRPANGKRPSEVTAAHSYLTASPPTQHSDIATSSNNRPAVDGIEMDNLLESSSEPVTATSTAPLARPNTLPLGVLMDYVAPNTVRQLLQLHDSAFVSACYEGILGRPADPTGMAHYLHLIRDGAPKMQVISDLAHSSEGLQTPGALKGLAAALSSYRRSRLPFIGWYFRTSTRQEGNSSAAIGLRRIENQIFRLTISTDNKLSDIELAVSEVLHKVDQQARALNAVVQGVRTGNSPFISPPKSVTPDNPPEFEELSKRAQGVFAKLRQIAMNYSSEIV